MTYQASQSGQYEISRLKPLSNDQYEAARTRAVERVRSRIGERPNRRRFERELGAIVTPLDYLAFVVFVAALIISSAHIIQYMKLQAAASYHVSTQEAPSETAGLYIDLHAYTLAHEIGAILLAEAAAILFMTMHNLTAAQRAQRPAWTRALSVPLALALTAAVFVFVANISSGVNVLISVMPPLFTLGVGLRLEALIVEHLRRRDDITQRYLRALVEFEAASADPTQHAEYRALLKQEVWQALAKLPSNRAFVEAPAAFKHAAARREMQRDSWAYEADHPIAGHPEAPTVSPAGEFIPFSNPSVLTANLVKRLNGNGNGRVHATGDE